MSMTMIEAVDTPMIDFHEDGDVPMAADSWFQQNLSSMEEDPVEVDMMSYNETTEYEMGDDAVVDADAEPSVDIPSADAVVYDVTIHNSPPSHTPEVEIPQGSGGLIEPVNAVQVPGSAQDDNVQPTEPPVVSDVVTSHAGLEILAISTIPEHVEVTNVQENDNANHTEPVSTEDTSDLQHAEPASQAAEHAAETSNEVQPDGDEVEKFGEFSDGPIPAAHDEPPAVHDENDNNAHTDPSEEVSVLLNQEENVANTEGADDEISYPLAEEEENQEVIGRTEDVHRKESDNPAERIYDDAPPPISLTLQLTSIEGDQPEFAIFCAPNEGTSASGAEEPLILLQHHLSLFYEPITAVFEAFRQEEYFTHIEELSEAEMVINAYELQLVISEDNIYSREVSLHDLYAMHQGIGLSGHLKLTLQSIVPRFITRYNQLRDQITRLAIGEEVEDARKHVPIANGEEESVHGVENQVDGREPEAQVASTDSLPGKDDEPQTIDDGEDSYSQKAVQEDDDSEQDLDAVPLAEAEQDAEQEASHSAELGIREEIVSTLPDEEHALEEADEESYEDETASSSHSINEEQDEDAEGSEENPDEYDAQEKQTGFDLTGEADVDNKYHPGLGMEPPGETEKVETTLDVLPPLAGDLISASASYASHETMYSNETEYSWDTADSHAQEHEETVVDHLTADDAQPSTEGQDQIEDAQEDIGNDVEDDCDDVSEEDTLEDLTEVRAEEEDAAAQAILLESERFLSNLADGNLDESGLLAPDSNQTDGQKSPFTGATAGSSGDMPMVRHKSSGKRSLRDADLGEVDEISPPDSPGSKRTRVH